MTYLLIFIFGMVFVSFLYPILDAVSIWVQNLLGAKSVKLQVDTERIKAEVDETPAHAIGFQIPSEEDWEEDDE